MDLNIHVNRDAPAEPLLALPAPAPRPVSAFDLLASQPWAMLPAMLETLSAIARRENEPVEALEARLGRPLQNARSVSLRGNVAVVPVTGPIFRHANLFTQVSGATSLELLARDFTAAADDPQVESIVLDIDSPGGQANGIAEFAHLVRAAKKPVTAYVGGAAASAAYWIAAAASEVVLAKTAEVGSIGVVVALDTEREPGVVEIVSSQSPKKRPDVTTDAGRSQIQARIDTLAQVFVQDVAAYRGVGVDTVMARFGQGDMLLGADAVFVGMADRVSTLEEVIAGLAGIPNTGGPRMGAQISADDTPAAVLDFLIEHQFDALKTIEDEARAKGATAERARILAVEAQALPGHEALIAHLKADGVTTGEQAAMAVLAAERAGNGQRLDKLFADAPAPVPHAAAPEPGDTLAAEAALPVEERCARQWARDTALAGEFSSVEAFTAYARSIESGRARVLGAKPT